MKKNSYFVKSIIGLGLIGTIALASDIEINDEVKDFEIKSSIQLKDNISEKEEKMAAKIDVSDVCNILKKKESGKIIKVELENEDGNLIYHSEIIKDSGESLDVIIDAGTGEILHN
jgi:uncharacterized membrane protein YkoI